MIRLLFEDPSTCHLLFDAVNKRSESGWDVGNVDERSGFWSGASMSAFRPAFERHLPLQLFTFYVDGALKGADCEHLITEA